MKEHMSNSVPSKWGKHGCVNKTTLCHEILWVFKQNGNGNDRVIEGGIWGGHSTCVYTPTMIQGIWKWSRVGKIATPWWEDKNGRHQAEYQHSCGCDCQGPPFIDSNSVSASSHIQNVAATDFNQRIGHETTVCNVGSDFLEGPP